MKKTKAEREYMGRVAELGCIACRLMGYFDTPAELHHVRANAGIGQRSSHFDVIPLCPIHHRAGTVGTAFHAGKKSFEFNFGTELELLEQTKGLLNV